MDGTFDQRSTLKRIPFGKNSLYSLDLSAATDRLPIQLQEMLLAEYFGDEFSKQ
jgi:hypothetical protein